MESPSFTVPCDLEDKHLRLAGTSSLYGPHVCIHVQGYWKPDGEANRYHVAIKVLKNTSTEDSKELLQVYLFIFLD